MLNSIIFNPSLLLYILNKKYDDTYSKNNKNYFCFYQIYRVANTVDNAILSLNNQYYENKTWDNFIDSYFSESFNNEDSKQFSNYIWNSFLKTANLVEKNIENIWQGLDLKIDDIFNVDYIYSIIYTFVKRYETFTT